MHVNKHKKIIRFLISGGSAAAVEMAVFALILGLTSGLLIIVPQTISFLAGFMVSFSLNRSWVFSAKNGKIATQLARYGLLAAINLVLSNIVLLLLVDVASMHELVAKFMVMACVAVWNYIIFSKIIFKA